MNADSLAVASIVHAIDSLRHMVAWAAWAVFVGLLGVMAAMPDRKR